MANLIEFGSSKAIAAAYYLESLYRQSPTRFATGPEGQRIDLVGSIGIKIADYSGGIWGRSTPGHWTQNLNRTYFNEGIITRIPGYAGKGYEVTTQAALEAIDASGFRDANTKAHSFNTNIGQSKLRFGVGLGLSIYVTTSDSDHSLLKVSSWTDKITAAREMIWNSTRYMTFAGAGATDDIKGTTNINANPLTWTTLVALNAGDHIWAMENMWNVGPGYNALLGTYAGTRGIHYVPQSAAVPATPVRMVDTATRSVRGTLATTTTAAKNPTWQGADASVGDVQWDGGDVLSSNDSRGTATFTAASQTTGRLVAGGFFVATDVPADAYVEGILVEIERSQSAAGADTYDHAIEVLVNGNLVGSARAGADEWPTTDAYLSYGGSTDNWGDANVRGSDLPGLIVRIRARAASTWTSGGPRVDHVRVTVTYRLAGAALDLPNGGILAGKLPWAPATIALLAPLSNDATGNTVPRELVYLTLSYDVGSDRPTGTISKPATGLVHVEDAVPHLGGVLCTGDLGSGLGKAIKHIDSTGEPRNWTFLGSHGATAVGVATMFSHGSTAIIDVANEAATDSQWWSVMEGKYNADWPLQSKSNAIALAPIAWAEKEFGLEMRRIYRFFPVSTTALACSRSFVPRGLYDDPLIANTTEPKQNGALYLQTPELVLGGREEGNNALTSIRYLGRQASAVGGTYGTVQYEFSDDNAATFAVSTGQLNTAFQRYQVLSSGQAFRTGVVRMTLVNADGSSAKTGNGLPYLLTIVAEDVAIRSWQVFLDVPEDIRRYKDWSNMVETLIALANTKATQQFRLGTVDVPATIMDYRGMFEVPELTTSTLIPSKNAKEPPWFLFVEKEGTTATS